MAVANGRHCLSVSRFRSEYEKLRSALSGSGYKTRHEFLDRLLEQEWGEVSGFPLIESPTLLRFSRQIAEYTTFCSRKRALTLHDMIQRSRVAIVGLGGIGTNFALQLARIGVSRFILIDGDRIDESNLNRQVLYYQSDINKLKVKVAKRELLRITGLEAEVLCYPQTLDSHSVDYCSTADFVVVSADSSPALIRQIVSRFCYPRKIPYAFAHYAGTNAIIGPVVLTFSEGCGCCLVNKTRPQEWIFDLNLQPRTFIPASGMGVNGLIASLILEIWTHALAEAGPTTGQWRIDVATLRVAHERSVRLNSCPICGEASPND